MNTRTNDDIIGDVWSKSTRKHLFCVDVAITLFDTGPTFFNGGLRLWSTLLWKRRWNEGGCDRTRERERERGGWGDEKSNTVKMTMTMT